LYNNFVSYKRNIYLLLFIASVVFILTLSTCYSRFGDICGSSGDINESVALSLVLFSASFFLLSLISLFIRKEIFRLWIRFAKYYLPIAALLVILSPETSGGGFGFNMGVDAELTIWWTAGLFLFLALIIIIYQTISIRRKERVTRTDS